METINLKAAVTFRVVFGDRPTSFATKAFRGEKRTSTVPDTKDLVPFTVHEIAIDSDTTPWLRLTETIKLEVLWSNVLSRQAED